MKVDRSSPVVNHAPQSETEDEEEKAKQIKSNQVLVEM